jgi:hypothetical protein
MQIIIATMSTKKVMSIVALVTAAAIFALSSVLVNPVLAQSYGGGEGDDDGSARENYKEFQKCLSDDETNGVVTEQQIRDCFSPIYNPNGSSSGSSSGTTSTTDYGNSDSDDYNGGTTSTTDYGNSDSDDYNDDDMEDNKQK